MLITALIAGINNRGSDVTAPHGGPSIAVLVIGQPKANMPFGLLWGVGCRGPPAALWAPGAHARVQPSLCFNH